MQQLLLSTINRLEDLEKLVMEKDKEIKSLEIKVATQQKQLVTQENKFTEEIRRLQTDLVLGKYTNYTAKGLFNFVYYLSIATVNFPFFQNPCTNDNCIIRNN